MAALEDAFVEFAGRAETAVVSADDPGARLIAARLGRGLCRFGFGDDADVRIADVAQHADRTEATVRWRGGRSHPVRLRVPGVHNLRNAVAALGRDRCHRRRRGPGGGGAGGVRRRGAPVRAAGRARRRRGGGRLRAPPLGAVGDARRGAGRRYPGRRLVAVFQPHLYSRTAAHGQAMGEALAAADLVGRDRGVRRARAADRRRERPPGGGRGAAAPGPTRGSSPAAPTSAAGSTRRSSRATSS